MLTQDEIILSSDIIRFYQKRRNIPSHKILNNKAWELVSVDF